MTNEQAKQIYEMMSAHLDEKQRRLLAGAVATAYGRGGKDTVAGACKMSPATVSRGIEELKNPATIVEEGVRQPGAGRKSATEYDPELLEDLDKLIAPETRGDPESPLRWTCKSTRKLAQELQDMKAGSSSLCVRKR